MPHTAFPPADWGDTFEVTTTRTFADAEHAARSMIEALPGWAKGLMTMRDRIVGPLGLKTGDQMLASSSHDCVGFFPIVENSENRIILGEDDAHLNFRVCVDLGPVENGNQRIALSTLVKRNNLAGRSYLATIMPFHKLIARTMLGTLR